jgi:CheY-like chemotaxis protein
MDDKPKILIADDSDPFRHALYEMLWREYSVCCVSDGVELYRLLAAGHEFDLVIADISMPGMDGDEGIAKAGDALGNTPVIFISGVSGLDRQVDLAKPFGKEDLLAKIRGALGRDR